MPVYGKDGGLVSVSKAQFDMNRTFANGARKTSRPVSRASDYGPRIRATTRPSVMPTRRMQRASFNYEAKARGNQLGSYVTVDKTGTRTQETEGEETMGRRGRSRGATDIFAGPKFRAMSLSPELGGDTGPDTGTTTYVEVPAGIVEMGGIGQAMPTVTPTFSQQVWRRDLEAFSKEVSNLYWGSTTSAERRAYKKGMSLVESGKIAYAGNLQGLSAVNAIASELDRWLRDHSWTITGVGSNQFGLGKIRDRVLKGINVARTIVGITAIPTAPIVPTVPALLPGAPGAPGVPIAPSPELPVGVAPPTFLERNKTMVIGGVALAAVVGGYIWWTKRR